MSKAKIDSILEYSSFLQQTLNEQPRSDPGEAGDLDTYLAALPLPFDECSQSQRTAFKNSAIFLWNSCIERRTESGESTLVRKEIAAIQTYAFLLLESIIKPVRGVSSSTQDDPATLSSMQLRHFRLGVDVARMCLGEGLNELAMRVMDLLVARYEDISTTMNIDQDQAGQVRSSVIEFVCLRMTANWKRDRLDLAVHQQNSLIDTVKSWSADCLPHSAIEGWLDLLYEIGSDQMSRLHTKIALTWLRFAKDLLQNMQNVVSFLNYEDTHFNILHTYTRCLLSIEDVKVQEEAISLLRAMRNDHQDKLSLSLLYLETLCKNPHSLAEDIATELAQVIGSVHLHESNHRLVIFYIHQLQFRSGQHAVQSLCQYLIFRLAQHSNHEWLDSATILLISIATSPNEMTDVDVAVPLLSNINLIFEACKHATTMEAARASLMFLWRQVGPSASNTTQSMIAWCTIGLHKLFGNAGDDYLGKFQRRLISCYLSLSQLEPAKAILDQMNPAVRKHQLSNLLAYRIELFGGNEQGTHEASIHIVSAPDTSIDIQIACIGETIKYGTDLQSARLLQRLFDKCVNGNPGGVDVPVLLRCLARLLIGLTDKPNVDMNEILTRLCAVLKAACTYDQPANSYKKSAKAGLPDADRQWLSRQAYKVAIEHIKLWSAKMVIDVLQYSYELYQQSPRLPTIAPVVHRTEIELMIMFIQALLYTSEARLSHEYQRIDDLPRTSYASRSRPSTSQFQYTLYQNVFDRYLQLSKIHNDRQQLNGGIEGSDLHEQLCILIPLAFEALLHMSLEPGKSAIQTTMIDEVNLIQTIDNAARIRATPKTFALLCDLVLCAASPNTPVLNSEQINTADRPRPRLPLPCATRLLNKTISAVRNTSCYSLEQAARWIRCIVQLIIDHHDVQTNSTIVKPNATSSSDAATVQLLKSIVSQALALAKSAAPVPNSLSSTVGNRYPEDELTYLATVLFNLSIDLYIAENIAQARIWADLAVEVADIMSSRETKTSLAALLRGRIAELPGLGQ